MTQPGSAVHLPTQPLRSGPAGLHGSEHHGRYVVTAQPVRVVDDGVLDRQARRRTGGATAVGAGLVTTEPPELLRDPHLLLAPDVDLLRGLVQQPVQVGGCGTADASTVPAQQHPRPAQGGETGGRCCGEQQPRPETVPPSLAHQPLHAVAPETVTDRLLEAEDSVLQRGQVEQGR